MTDDVLITTNTGRIRVLTLNRPAARNAFSGELITRLYEALVAADADGSVSVVVLTGADPAFCAGAVNGAAFTGGLELALGCDLLVASRRAVFADTNVRVGVLPGGGMTARLSRAVGSARARRMSLTGEVMDADLALRIGLVTEVVEHSDLIPRVQQLASAIADVDRELIPGLKQQYVEGGDTTLAGALIREREIAGATPIAFERIDQRREEVMI
jgi:enoyl-CoA hydratase